MLQSSPSSCHAVFCTGRLLQAVQAARLFPDSKTFVDMPIRSTPETVLAAFDKLASGFAGTLVADPSALHSLRSIR